MQRSSHIQDNFLMTLQRERQNVTVYLMNGFQLRGHVGAHDSFTVVLNSEGKQQMIYKHAISTIIPEKAVPLDEAPV